MDVSTAAAVPLDGGGAAATTSKSGVSSSLPPLGIEREQAAKRSSHLYLWVLPVLFLEFLAIALSRSLLPQMMVDFFGDWTYHIIGLMETVKGLLAFVACPMFGKLSDIFGRRKCLLLTVLGTTLPVCSLALARVRNNLWGFVALSALSGVFSATFPLTFAYIADLVPSDGRAPAYGLALATFGLSFTLGPVAGSYLSKESGVGSVFSFAVFLVCLDVAFIVLKLPESKEDVKAIPTAMFTPQFSKRKKAAAAGGGESDSSTPGGQAPLSKGGDLDFLGIQWNPISSLTAFRGNPLLSRVAIIVFLYYVGVWALVSTLMVYVVKRFSFGTVMVGQLLSAFGVCMMFAEGILVRVMVPRLGEKLTLQIGLLGFASQVWNVPTKGRFGHTQVVRITAHSMSITSLYLSPSHLYSACDGAELRMWSLSTLGLQRVFRAPCRIKCLWLHHPADTAELGSDQLFLGLADGQVVVYQTGRTT